LYIRYLPTYSPELNPIEIVWKFAKQYWLPISAYLSYENLVTSVEYVLKNIGSEFRIEFGT
jgi:transposase